MSILFLSHYPQKHNTKDGMIQRIAAVDAWFTNEQRYYLSCGLLKNFKQTKLYPAENVIVHQCNLFLHSKAIIKAFQQQYKAIYIHSVFNCGSLFMYRKFISGALKHQTLVLDVHGVVPEELNFYKRKLLSIFFGKVERWAFRNISKAIFVTHRMEAHFTKKYPNFSGCQLVYNIFPNSLIAATATQISALLELDLTKTIIIYSGGSQKWQNVDKMLDAIQANLSNKIQYIISTGEKDIFETLLRERGMQSSVLLFSLTSNQLSAVYGIADYGFILRDDVLINQVANPTKMIEYLYFGIVPIVISEKIGDFYEMGYEHVNLKDFSSALPKAKSSKNKQIAKEIEARNSAVNLKHFVIGK